MELTYITYDLPRALAATELITARSETLLQSSETGIISRYFCLAVNGPTNMDRGIRLLQQLGGAPAKEIGWNESTDGACSGLRDDRPRQRWLRAPERTDELEAVAVICHDASSPHERPGAPLPT